VIPAMLLSLIVSNAPGVAGPMPAPELASLALIVASNRGSKGGRPPLQYADDDGAKYQQVFSALAGEENTILLTDFDRDTARLFPELVAKVRSPTRVQLDQAVDRLARKAVALKGAGRTVRFYFVFAGHGDVDQGRGFIELADGPFTADDLQLLLRTIDPTEAHVILDSCNSFFVVNPRKPGGVRFATPRDAAESLARRLPNVGVFLSTAAQAEVFEWSELQSGVFSHAVRSGLMGAADADGDGRVSYQELAGFVETAAADIKNPLFRPKVFARGPNGEDGRAILDVPRASRTVLTVTEPGSVRLAVRDVDGLRWLDAYKEPGAPLNLWFPPSLSGRLEVERLRMGGSETGEVEASYSVPGGGTEPVALAALTPTRSTLGNRGPGEIFQALFTRPFGPTALAAYLSQGAMGREPEVDSSSRAFQSNNTTPESDQGRGSLDWFDERPGNYLALRPGATLPQIRASGSTVMSSPVVNSGMDLALVAGREFYAFFAAELEGGYFQLSTVPWRFLVPGEIYINRSPPNATLKFRVVPLGLNVKLQLPTKKIRPYLLGGAGFAIVNVEADLSDFNPLRATRSVTEWHAGGGLTVDVTDRLFGGLEGRYFSMGNANAFDVVFGLSGVRVGATIGYRL
jgi:hypothetical protein